MVKKSLCCLRVEDNNLFNEMFDIIFSDLSAMDYYIVKEKDQRDRIIDSAFRRHKAQKYFHNIVAFHFKSYYELSGSLEKLSKEYETVIVLFTNNSLMRSKYPEAYIHYLRKKYSNVIWVLFYLDTMSKRIHCAQADILRKAGAFDYVYTYDPDDARREGICFCYIPYSKSNIAVQNDYDLYYCSTNHTYLPKLVEIARRCEANGAKCLIDLAANAQLYDEDFVRWSCKGIELHDTKQGYLPYSDILNKTVRANCIMELVGKNCRGATIKTLEAIHYNKKLLTNNPEVVDLPCYNPNFIKIFNTPDDIDWEWIRKVESVDYNVGDYFSPLKLINSIYYERGRI